MGRSPQEDRFGWLDESMDLVTILVFQNENLLHKLAEWGWCCVHNRKAVGECGGLGTCELMDAQATQSASFAREIRDVGWMEWASGIGRSPVIYRPAPWGRRRRPIKARRQGQTLGRGYLGCQIK